MDKSFVGYTDISCTYAKIVDLFLLSENLTFFSFEHEFNFNIFCLSYIERTYHY